MVTAAEMQAILDACEHLRNRLLLAILCDAGVQIGEALGLRHEDIAVAEREVTTAARQRQRGAVQGPRSADHPDPRPGHPALR